MKLANVSVNLGLIMSVNVIKRVMLVNIQTMKIVSALVAPLIEKCTETVEEVKLAKITLVENENSYKVLAQCILCYFVYFSQLALVE